MMPTQEADEEFVQSMTRIFEEFLPIITPIREILYCDREGRNAYIRVILEDGRECTIYCEPGQPIDVVVPPKTQYARLMPFDESRPPRKRQGTL